jgi:integrase
MGSIYRRSFGSGTHCYINYLDDHGRRARESLGKITRKEAESILRSRLGDVENARHSLAAPKRQVRILFKDFADDHFLKEYKDNSKESSCRTCKCVFQAYIIPFFKGMYLDEIEADHIEEYKRFRSNYMFQSTSRRKDRIRVWVSKSTVNKDLGLLKYLFNYAWKRDYILRNPAKQIRQFRTPKKDPRFLSNQEIGNFPEACDQVPAMKQMAFVAALYTGMRFSELYNLKWENADFGQKRIHMVSKED